MNESEGGNFKKIKDKFRMLKATCNICGGKGHIPGEEGYFKDCPGCTKKMVIFQKIVECGLPDEFFELEMEDLQPILTQHTYKNFAYIISKIEKVVCNYQMMVYLADDIYAFGSKTILALILKELANKDYDVEVIPFSRLHDCCFDFNNSVEVNSKRILELERLKDVRILGITDFDNNYKYFDASKFVYKKIVEFLNIRRMNGGFTIISTDQTKQSFYEAYSGSLTTMLSNYYLPFIVQCHDGKYKHSAESKLKKDDPELHEAFKEPEPVDKILNVPTKRVSPEVKEDSDDSLDVAFNKGKGSYDKRKK